MVHQSSKNSLIERNFHFLGSPITPKGEIYDLGAKNDQRLHKMDNFTKESYSPPHSVFKGALFYSYHNYSIVTKYI